LATYALGLKVLRLISRSHQPMKSKDQLGNYLLHDLGCPAADGQDPVIAKQPLYRVPAHESVTAEKTTYLDSTKNRYYHGILEMICIRPINCLSEIEPNPDEPEKLKVN